MTHSRSSIRYISAAALVLFALAGSGSAATFVVNSAADPGNGICDSSECTLREALTASGQQGVQGPHVIRFAIGSGAATIQPLSRLPQLFADVTLDGTTQPGFAGKPLIELDGSLAGDSNGLEIDGPRVVVRGIVVHSFGYSGINNYIPEASDVTIAGCYIGTDRLGTTAKPNGGNAIAMASHGWTIGGTTAADRNVISGNNGGGIKIDGPEATGNRVLGNYIGVDAAGFRPLPNTVIGVSLERNASGNFIGGVEPGAGNIIGFSQYYAPDIIVENGTRNALRGNSIRGDCDHGIGLGTALEPNDPLDADEGPNRLQNYPLVTSAARAGGMTTVRGTLDSAPNADFLIDVYASLGCWSEGSEGWFYLGTASVRTGAGGSASFTLASAAALGGITATATDAEGNTSPYSPCLLVASNETADVSISVVDTPDPAIAGEPITYAITIANAGPDTATDVLLVDELPYDAILVSAPSNCVTSCGVTRCLMGNLAPGAQTSLQIVVRVPEENLRSAAGAALVKRPPEPIVNTATASTGGGQGDPTPPNGVASTFTSVYPTANVADLSVSLSDSADPVATGAELTYTAVARNFGPTAATAVRLTVSLPATATFLSASSGCTHEEGIVTCEIGTLPNGAALSYAITVRAPALTVPLGASATVVGTETDLDSGNDTAQQSTAMTGLSSAFLPGQARLPGSGTSFFKSAVWMTNPAATSTRVRLTYVPAPGSGNGGAGGPVEQTLAPAQSLAWSDVLADIFGASTATAGNILVDTIEGPAPFVTSRTYNDAGTLGTFGQYIPSVPLLGSTGTLVIHGLGGDTASRTNVGVFNPGTTALTATLTVADAGGTTRGVSIAVPVTPRNSVQVNRVNEAAQAGPLALFSVSATADAPFYLYASKLDNVTSDPIFVPGTLVANATQWLDGLASAPGVGGTFFRSTLSVTNAGSTPAAARLRFVRRGETTASASADVTIAAGESLSWADVLDDLFRVEGAGWIEIEAEGGPLVAWARTFSDRGAAGSYGQFIPAFGPNDVVPAAGALFQGISETAEFRTNMGFVNIGRDPVTAALTAYSRDGVPRGTRTYTLAPRQSLFVPRILSALGAGSLADAYVRLVPGAPASLYGWASVVDNRSSDQIFVRPLVAQ